MQGGKAGPNREFWNGRRVLVVGNTGFKGAWLGLWLRRLGRERGRPFAAAADDTQPVRAGRPCRIWCRPTRADIRDAVAVRTTLRDCGRRSCSIWPRSRWCGRPTASPSRPTRPTSWAPCTCWRRCARCPTVRGVVVVTSDKCYENREWPWAYRETEAMGGHDPYSSSKGCAELVTAAYRRSFFPDIEQSAWRPRAPAT